MSKITVYIEKGSVYFDPQSQSYRTYTRDNVAFLEVGKTYYAYELDLPEEEIARIEKQDGSVKPTMTQDITSDKTEV